MSRRWAPAAVLTAAGSAIVLLALWLRNPVLPYGDGSGAASADDTVFSASGERSYESNARARGLLELRSALAAEEQRLESDARRALAWPAGPAAAFNHLTAIELLPEEGIVLFDGDLPVAWAGQVMTDPAPATRPVSISITPFYTTMQVVVASGARRAVATALVHAEPPSDRLARTLDSRIAGRDKLQSYTFGLPADSSVGEIMMSAGGAALLRADATPLPRATVGFGRTTALRWRGTLILSGALLVLIALAWRNRRQLRERLLALLISMVAVALVPWSSFSNTARAFDPTYYYSPMGGPLTANAGVLAMAGSLLLLAVFATIRSRHAPLSRAVATVGAFTMGAAGLLIATVVAAGIAYPSWGATSVLWLTWQIPIFVLLFAFWLAALWLARIALGARPTVHLRAAAAIAAVAGVTATGIVWRTTTSERLALAAQDIRGLQISDGNASALLRRFSSQLSRYDSAGTRDDLLRRYAISDLAAAGLPLTLASWTTAGERVAELRLAQVAYDSAFVAQLVRTARDSAQPVIAQTIGVNGRQVILVAAHSESGATSVVVSPRTQLIPPEPFVSLLGFSSPVGAEPPYALTISDATGSDPATSASLEWTRIGHALHANSVIRTSRGAARTHAEVDLRSAAALGERTVLIVVLNAAIAGLLWALGAMAEGGFLRWLRARVSKWIRSYHGRLTLALSAFFVIPALAFAIWSYQRLRSDDRDVRALLVRETLDAVVARGDSAQMEGVVRQYNTPLFLYSNGLLSVASDALLDNLSPAGRTLPQHVYASIGAHGEPRASWQQDVGATGVLFGYRAATGPRQEQYVLAAPARSDELALDRRRRDLAVLVLFATVVGALAALWLSRIAARRLARDLELSRIEVARAERVLAWGEMARQVAHEIKNPLTPIRLGVQHLRRARTDPRVDFDQVLETNVTRILSEIDRLDEIARAFSRYGSAPGELPPPETIDLASILRDVVALERMGVGDVSWMLTGAALPAFALARADELRDVLLNLFENARLARARQVGVALRRMPGKVLIDISDDGAGIDRAVLPRVFEPHFSTRTTGSGLGLAISRRLLESWGATIEIESEVGDGALVLLTFSTIS